MIQIDDLYDKLMDSNNIDCAENIDEHSDKEGWDLNIDTLKFDELPKLSVRHCWVRHIQSWKPMCKDCLKPNCPSVKILSHEIYQLSLQEIYCDCQKCDECGFIYDDECKCRASTQKPSDASENSRFVRCEHCCRTYDSFDATSQHIHDGRCC